MDAHRLPHPTQVAATARPDRLVALAPALAAMAYPFLLEGFHRAVSAGGACLFASIWLMAAFSPPAIGLGLALRSAGLAHPSQAQLRGRRLAYLSVAAPPLFVFLAFLLGVVGHPLPEDLAWVLIWSAAALWAWTGRDTEAPAVPSPPPARLRVAHGAIAAILLAYIGFHLANHMFGLVGPDAHAAVMKLGRRVYRAPAIEPVLVALLLTQVALGGVLSFRWSARAADRHRVFQIASGVYLWFFLLTHLNSALVSARGIHGTDTNWAWASGAPTGLIHDAWNIRLVPHYALGVFFILAHLASGLRSVLIAHGMSRPLADRAWLAGLLAAAAISAAILAGLCGMRIDAR